MLPCDATHEVILMTASQSSRTLSLDGPRLTGNHLPIPDNASAGRGR